MEDNPALDDVIVHDLNRNKRLPFDDSSFDAAVLTVSVQYLTSPIETFREMGRILKPRSPFIVTFSNRMFPTKAVAIWVGSTEAQRIALVERYFVDSAAFGAIEVIERNKDAGSDPVYAVIGYAGQTSKP
jgi:ubiquinone/menaquinone biosynthesis C-methylase UbiE